MKVDKLSISLSPELGDAVRESAGRRGIAVSGWFAMAAQHQLRSEALADALVLWEEEFGSIPDEAMTVALEERGAGPRKRTKSTRRASK